MGFMRIKKVIYLGDKYHFESPSLDDNICIIEGPNGTGKSTFFNFIYYCLGGKVEEFDPKSNEQHVEVMGDTNNLARIIVELNQQEFIISRKFKENIITIAEIIKHSSEAPPAQTLPVNRKDSEQKTFSDWLLEKLNIPVVEIFQAGRNFKLNFTDLARLIYHNQSPDPHGIFKPADNSNFVTDSLEIRRAIFQILIGKTLLALYEAFGKMKIADKDQQAARSVLQEYQDIVSELLKASGIDIIRNEKALLSEISELEHKLEKLLNTRNEQSKGKVDLVKNKAFWEAEIRNIQELERQRTDVQSRLSELNADAAKMIDLERVLNDDIERISKVIHTHQQLNLFSSDTCPYCLSTVLRPESKCVCGSSVNENEYQRFFYNSSEYLDILRSKSKTIETLSLAAVGVQAEITELKLSKNTLDEFIAQKRTALDEGLQSLDTPDRTVDYIDDEILEVRSCLSSANEALLLERKLGKLQKDWNNAKDDFDKIKLRVKQLEAAAEAEISDQLKAFNKIYNEFMTSVLSGCRTAAIDSDTYLPIINNGSYREASATVSKRFLYYLSLLQLSLTGDIPYPQLLLIDTPETAGIDFENLMEMISLIGSLKNPENKKFQILLSTGIGKYPEKYKEKVVFKLTKQAKLLEENI